jgi:hypothetical protein
MPKSTDFQPTVCYDLSAIIANGQTTSGAVDLLGTVLVGIIMPGTFTGTSLKFQTSSSLTGTYQNVYDGAAGADYSVTVAAGKYVAVDPTKLRGVRFLQIVSNSTEGQADTLGLVTKPVVS